MSAAPDLVPLEEHLADLVDTCRRVPARVEERPVVDTHGCVLAEDVAAALDVGHGQLADPVRADPRVLDLEGFNIRDVIGPGQLAGQPFDIVVSDLSFISLTLALPHMAFLLANTGHMVVLVKPQFEVGKQRLGRSGVVTSREQRRESIIRVVTSAASCGLRPHALAWSPMIGSQGNHEYLLWLRPAAMGDGMNAPTVRARIEELTRKDAP